MGEEEMVENGAVLEEEDGPVVDDERDSLRGSVRPGTKEDPEEEEDPVWQEFSQEYYEGVSSRLLSPATQAHRMSEQWWNNSHWRSIGISHSFEN
jgi:hypothetical protein